MSIIAADTSSAYLIHDTFNPDWRCCRLEKKIDDVGIQFDLHSDFAHTNLGCDKMCHRNIFTISILVNVIKHDLGGVLYVGIQIIFVKYCNFREHN